MQTDQQLIFKMREAVQIQQQALLDRGITLRPEVLEEEDQD